MKESEILRLLLIIRNGGSGGFKRNLSKIVSMVLYDSMHNKLSVDEIREEIKNKYDLEFTNEEIIETISNKKFGIIKSTNKQEIVRRGIAFSESIDYYSLDETTFNKYKTYDESDIMDKIITKFFQEKDVLLFSESIFKQLLMRFLYCTFNSNRNTLMQLLNKENSSISEDSNTEYTEDEKEILNLFLNWEDQEKDEMVFVVISYCVDYCMLTIKNNFSSYSDIFNGKSFYLDSNVIFRLAGINNEERKTVTTSFITKSIEQGITIKYTNFTYDEIKDTVKKNVDSIKALTDGRKMVSTNNIKRYDKNNINLSFLEMYEEWSRTPGNKYNDYNLFKKDIMSRIDSILRKFKKVDFMDYETSDENFKSYCNSLSAYKDEQKARYTSKSIKIDINNYLYVMKLRKKSKNATFIEIADYLISTDGNFCKWGERILPGAIPVAVLPSLWHSLILKFKGRTNDDYRAFSLFLNLRYRMPQDFDNRKSEILTVVQKLDEPVDMKNMILDDISSKFDENDLGEEADIKSIVEESKKSVIKKEAQKMFEASGKAMEITAKQEGEVETLIKLAENKADKKFKRWGWIQKKLDTIKIILGIFCLLFIAYFAFSKGLAPLIEITKNDFFGNTLADIIAYVGVAVTLISFLIIKPVKRKIAENFAFDKIKERELLKLKNQLQD